MSTTRTPLGKTTYVVSTVDRRWLLNVRRKLYALSQQNPDFVMGKLWGFVTDPHNLRIALARVCRNHGHRSAGVDGI